MALKQRELKNFYLLVVFLWLECQTNQVHHSIRGVGTILIIKFSHWTMQAFFCIFIQLYCLLTWVTNYCYINCRIILFFEFLTNYGRIWTGDPRFSMEFSGKSNPLTYWAIYHWPSFKFFLRVDTSLGWILSFFVLSHICPLIRNVLTL